MTPIKLSALRDEFSELISERRGDDVDITGFASPEGHRSGELIFCDDKKQFQDVIDGKPTGVVTTAELAEKVADPRIGLLISGDVKLAQAFIRQRYDDPDLHDSEWPRIHPSAVIHDSVTVPDSVTIGPGVVIGRDASISERVVVEANTVIEKSAVVGEDSVLHARVFVGHHCRIGKRVRLKPGCVIGADGFGFARDEDKHFHRVPQKGIVVLEDDVVVSANSTIDRATYSETRVARGTKIDALCHVAHNVFLDEDCVLVAQTGIAGSSRFGKRVLASGQTGVIDHITVADDVTLVHRAGLPEDIREPGMYAGGPAVPFRDYRRNISVFKKLSELRQRVIELEKQVKDLIRDRKGPMKKAGKKSKNFS